MSLCTGADQPTRPGTIPKWKEFTRDALILETGSPMGTCSAPHPPAPNGSPEWIISGGSYETLWAGLDLAVKYKQGSIEYRGNGEYTAVRIGDAITHEACLVYILAPAQLEKSSRLTSI